MAVLKKTIVDVKRFTKGEDIPNIFKVYALFLKSLSFLLLISLLLYKTMEEGTGEP